MQITNEKPCKKYLHELKSNATGSISNLLNKTPQYSPKKCTVPPLFASSISFRHDHNHIEKIKKLRKSPDISKIRTSSDYAGKRNNHVDHVESQYLKKRLY